MHDGTTDGGTKMRILTRRAPPSPAGTRPVVSVALPVSEVTEPLGRLALLLSIVTRVVYEAGGEVWLEPAEGGGTLARVRIPGSGESADVGGKD